MKKVYGECDRAEREGDGEMSQVEGLMAEAYKAIDKAAKQGAIHRNAANRSKQSLQLRKKKALFRLGLMDQATSPLLNSRRLN